MNTPIGNAPSLEAAENKLRQAEFHCDHLRSLAVEIARHSTRTTTGDFRLPLEAFCSASLGAANACFYILASQQFKAVKTRWLKSLPERERARFYAMLRLRDDDVHYGRLTAEVLATMIEAPANSNPYYQQHYNAALFGPEPKLEHTNPDGTVVRAKELQSSYGLYVDVCGKTTEVAAACTQFISQLRSLLREAGAAERSAAGPALPSG